MKRSINELSQLAKTTRAMPTDTALQPSNPVTVAAIDNQLGGQLGQPDMGWLRNRRARKHTTQAQLDAWKKIATAKYEQLGGLAVDALKAEAELIRERLRVEWNHQYAALAERAAVGEMSIVRKLEAVLDAGRELLYGDRADSIEKLQARHTEGQLTDEDFSNELTYLFNRYNQLLGEFVQIVEERRSGVRTAFRSTATKHE